jgi:hypothetical protein
MPRDAFRMTETGVDKVIEDLDQYAEAQDFKTTLDAALGVMFEAMRSTIPVRTGYLRSTARSESHVEGHEWTGSVHIGEGVPYLEHVYPAHLPSELDLIFQLSDDLFRDALRY